MSNFTHLYEVYKANEADVAQFNSKPFEDSGLTIENMRLSVFGRLSLPGEVLSLKDLAVRLIFSVFSAGNAFIFYVKNKEGKIIHTTIAVKKMFKFPFMKREDFEIGPCTTQVQFRGRGIYPNVLKHVVTRFGGGYGLFICLLLQAINLL